MDRNLIGLCMNTVWRQMRTELLRQVTINRLVMYSFSYCSICPCISHHEILRTSQKHLDYPFIYHHLGQSLMFLYNYMDSDGLKA